MTSARLGLPGASSPWPLHQGLPSLLRDDALAIALTGAIDTMLGPVVMTLDSLDAYVTPATAPWDWLAWLGDWVGESVQSDAVSDEPATRERVSRAVSAATLTGTAAGLQDRISTLLGGVEVAVSDPGATSWSPSPGGVIPGAPGNVVTVTVPDGTDLSLVARIAGPFIPAHMTLEVTS